MPVKKRIAKGRAHRIVPEHLDLWRQLRGIHEAGTHAEFEPDGRRREYLDAKTALRRGLGLPPWSYDPIDARGSEPPDYLQHNPLQLASWARAWELRCALDDACRGEANPS